MKQMKSILLFLIFIFLFHINPNYAIEKSKGKENCFDCRHSPINHSLFFNANNNFKTIFRIFP